MPSAELYEPHPDELALIIEEQHEHDDGYREWLDTRDEALYRRDRMIPAYPEQT